MKNIIKNISFVLAGVIIAGVAFNPTVAYQIQSNLAKGFAAITASDVKEENKLVGLDADGLLPSDIFPASALTADVGSKNSFCMFASLTAGDRSIPVLTCPTGYLSVTGLDYGGSLQNFTMYVNGAVTQTYNNVYGSSFRCCVME